ncbi:pancreatic triacylglycerol lipase-like [Bactrocera tryoni]|uniref:pancreatic triacylglycerol lipase-like n=1 Tax=Bactrocera tryoni TaxID=59916 RepID=UPI001A97CC11|nr:pancreatic triacylglycerol lipase-like [Bactrocera tryoni]
MKFLVILALFAITAWAAPVDDEDGWYVPQADGSLVWMTSSEAENMLAEHEEKEKIMGRLDLSPVTYYLYTLSNQNDGQIITADKDSISNSHFDASHPTRVLIHGWTQSYKTDMNVNIRDAWLSHGEYNIIVVDWARAR